MGFIQFDGVGLSFGDRRIFGNVNLTVSPRSRIALTGANGSGKSTLMKTAAGLTEYDEGRIICPKGTRCAYLPQSGITHSGKNLKEEALTAFDELASLHSEADLIALELEQGGRESLLNRYQEISDILENAEWDRREARTEVILKGLGFSGDDLHRSTAEFSGGWQMRIALAKILLQSPDIMLLDEPTNYLDLEAREWLQDFLKKFQGGVLLVSHDRSFLDNSCTQVAELLTCRLSVFKGRYSDWESVREKRAAELVERWKRQQEEIARIEAFINRFRYKESKAVQVQSRIKMLDKMERIEIPAALKRMRLRFPPAPHSGKTTLRAADLGKCYGDKTVFSGLDLELPRGSRTAVTGVNGAGKTTLLRIISGHDADFDGTVTFGQGVKTGYFSQDIALDPQLTVLQEAARGTDTAESRLRDLLGAFLFSGDDISKTVSVLSGGEQNRLALLKILLQPVNLLILDEPTNHLDLYSKDILLEALGDFGGTLVIVSHDRYFLEHSADRILEIKDTKGQLYPGSYAEWRQFRDGQPPEETPKTTAPDSGKQRAREEHKKRRAEMNRLRRNEEKLAAALDAAEQEAARLRAALEQPENYSDPEKAGQISAEIEHAELQINTISSEWEQAALALEDAGI